MDQIKLSHFVHCTTECIYTECGRKERKKIWRRRRRHHLDWDLHRAKMCVFSLYTEIGWQRNDISVAKMNEEKFKFFSCSLLCFHNMYSLPFFIAFHCLHFHGYQVTRIYRFIVSLTITTVNYNWSNSNERRTTAATNDNDSDDEDGEKSLWKLIY